MNLPSETNVVVVGAGPAGLAVSACLRRREIDHVLLEKEEAVAPTWRHHYDRLHLHTSRDFSGLPYFPVPRRMPKYLSRMQVVEYLDEYVVANGLDPLLGVSVDRIRKNGESWTTTTSIGSVRSRAVVIATGYNREPVIPDWPGIEHFVGSVLHSSLYKNGDPYVNQNVLVVGFGNSGGEIALDLAESDAHPTISVRSPVNIIPRDVLGVSNLVIAVPLANLPPRIADLMSWPLLKMYYPSYARLGLKKARRGPFTQMAVDRQIPLLDIGTVREIRNGRIQVVGEIQSFGSNHVCFTDGKKFDFDAVVLATGYKCSVDSILPDDCHVTDEDGAPFTSGARTSEPGLFFCGFYVSPTGALREIGFEANWIAAAIAEG